MKKQSLFILASLFFTFSTNGSFRPVNSLIENEYPKAPCSSPTNYDTSFRSISSLTESSRKTAESTTTIPHLVENLSLSQLLHDDSILHEDLSPAASPLLEINIKKISNNRSFVSRISKGNRSSNWREDSCISPNNNAENIELCLSKNEQLALLYKKSYLAAALRGKNKV